MTVGTKENAPRSACQSVYASVKTAKAHAITVPATKQLGSWQIARVRRLSLVERPISCWELLGPSSLSPSSIETASVSHNHVTEWSLLVFRLRHINRPVARKAQGISLCLITRDVITGCSGGRVKCIAVQGEIATARFHSLAGRAQYRIFLFRERSVILKSCQSLFARSYSSEKVGK